MNKQEFLKDYRKQEDKICLSQVLDKIEFSKTREKLESTDFLDMYQVSLVENFLRKIQFKNYKLFGGYDDAERKIFGVFPDYILEREETFPISFMSFPQNFVIQIFRDSTFVFSKIGYSTSIFGILIIPTTL